MKWMARLFLGIIVIGLAGNASAQGVIVDHSSVALFEQIPDEFLRAAADMPMVFVNRSVGANISDGLTCLAYPSDAAAPTACKRYLHAVSEFSSPQSEVQWSRPGGYSRAKWQFFGWPGSGILPELPSCQISVGFWYQYLQCFINYVDTNPLAYKVYSYMNSYLEVTDDRDISSPTTGYFARQANRFDIGDLEALEARQPTRIFLHHTTSLARSIGTHVSTDFNNQMRDYVRTNNKFLLDVADIESHDPWGRPCYDNRDGVPYSGGGGENYADDGLNLPAICQHYTPETNGGHLGSPEVGKIRIAKAFWVMMARIAGWNPGGGTAPPSTPTNLRIVPGASGSFQE